MRKQIISTLVLPVLAALALAACSPKYNWRDYSSADAPYSAMFPDKPATHTRSVDLDGMKVDMTMTAADIDGTIFAIGSAQAPDAAKADAAVAAMKTALVRNIGATITSEKVATAPAAVDIDARGMQNGVPMRLVGHFEARGTRFYQVIVMGRDKDMPQDEVDMFMSSFKLN
jgi:hypothetical protein